METLYAFHKTSGFIRYGERDCAYYARVQLKQVDGEVSIHDTDIDFEITVYDDDGAKIGSYEEKDIPRPDLTLWESRILKDLNKSKTTFIGLNWGEKDWA